MIFDYQCPSCKEEKLDEWVRNFKEEVKCPKCDTIMEKKISSPNIGGMDRFGRSGNH